MNYFACDCDRWETRGGERTFVLPRFPLRPLTSVFFVLLQPHHPPPPPFLPPLGFTGSSGWHAGRRCRETGGKRVVMGDGPPPRQLALGASVTICDKGPCRSPCRWMDGVRGGERGGWMDDDGVQWGGTWVTKRKKKGGKGCVGGERERGREGRE